MKKQTSTAAAAARATSARKQKGFGLGAACVLLALLVLPALLLELLCYRFSWPLVLGITAGIWLLTFFVVRGDKASAQAGEWRTPEATLHLLELLGGWPASFLAQRIYWHKVSKFSYQFVFWLIVALYQLVIFDYIQAWKWATRIGSLLLSQSGMGD